MSILDTLKFGFSLAVPASDEVLKRIAEGVLVHRTRLKYLPDLITKVLGRPDDFANCEVSMTGNFGYDPLELAKATLRDHRIVDFDIFGDSTGKGFTSFTYFFLGEPDAAQMDAQNYGGDGEFATIRVRGRDLLSDPRRKIFYRRGLFWEADKAVVVKGGYEGPAQVTPFLTNSRAPMG